jgi:hypothetical protein
MKYINTKTKISDIGLVGFSLIWVIVAITLMIFTIVSGGFSWCISEILFVVVVFLLPATFVMDIFLWNAIGKEIIFTYNKQLKIRKTNRIFHKTKIIRFDQIKDIYLWNQKVWYSFLYNDLSFWDISRQGAICVRYNRRKYYFGRCLTKEEAQNLLDLLFQEMNRN